MQASVIHQPLRMYRAENGKNVHTKDSVIFAKKNNLHLRSATRNWIKSRCPDSGLRFKLGEILASLLHKERLQKPRLNLIRSGPQQTGIVLED